MDRRLAEHIFGFFVGVTVVCVGFGVAVAGDEAKYETGVVRNKKDSALYLSPVNDTLVERKILFTNSPTKSYKAYEAIQIGDTLKFENPTRDPIINAGYSYSDMKVNNKDIKKAIEQFNRTKQLQQIQRESRQK